MGVRLWRSERSFEDSHSHGSHRQIQFLGVDLVAIVNHKAIVVFVVHHFAKLLQGPGCGGMGSDIEMDESSRAHLHDHKHIDDVKADGDRDEEVTGQHALGMIANEGHPALGWNPLASTTLRILQQILLNGAGRHLDSQFQEKFRCDAGLAPGRIVPGHGQDELTQIFGNPGSADRSGFPPPEQFKPSAVPSRKGLWSNRNQSFLPIKQSCRQYHREPRGIGGPSRSNLTFLVEGQLFAQEEILSGQGGAGTGGGCPGIG